jgi:hypothetical protein
MQFSSIIAKAHHLARPVKPSEDCRAGDVSCVSVAQSGNEFTGVAWNSNAVSVFVLNMLRLLKC